MKGSNVRKEKLRKAAHFLAAFVILMHGLERWDGGHSSFIYFLIAGLVFGGLAIFHHPLQARYPWIDTVFICIEAALSFVIAYEYFHMGKKGIPYLYLLAGTMQLIAVVIFAKKRMQAPPPTTDAPTMFER